MKFSAKHILAYGAIVAMCVALFMVWYATEQRNQHYGPSKLRVTPQGEVWILSDGSLYRLDDAGVLQQTIQLKAWQLAFLPSDFIPLANGDFLIAESDTHEIYRCRQQAACTPLLNQALSSIGNTKKAMQLAVDETRQRLYVADNAHHRLLLLDLEGHLLAYTERRKRVWYPNQIMLQGGDLLVTDTNHRRLLRIPVANDQFNEETWTLPTAAAKVRNGRFWPMAFVPLPDGQWWIAIAREGMRNADVAMFDASQKPTDYVRLEVNADPVSMVLLNNRVLLADTENYRIRQVSLTGQPLADFGSQAFREILKQQAAQPVFWGKVRSAAQISVVVLPLLAILLLIRAGERGITLPVVFNFQREALPIPPGTTHWLTLSPKFVQQQIWLLRGFSFVTLFITGWSLWILFEFIPKFHVGAWIMAALLLGGLGTVYFSIYLGFRLLRSRLGTDGEQIFHDKGDGKIFAYPLAQVITDGTRVLAGKRLFVLRIMQRMLFDRDELEQYLLARLGPAALRKPGQFYLAGLKQRSPVFWLNTILILLGLLAWAASLLGHFPLQKILTEFLTKLLVRPY